MDPPITQTPQGRLQTHSLRHSAVNAATSRPAGSGRPSRVFVAVLGGAGQRVPLSTQEENPTMAVRRATEVSDEMNRLSAV